MRCSSIARVEIPDAPVPVGDQQLRARERMRVVLGLRAVAQPLGAFQEPLEPDVDRDLKRRRLLGGGRLLDGCVEC